MRGLGDYLLLALQWALVLVGALLIYASIRVHVAIASTIPAAASAAVLPESYYAHPGLIQGICLGLMSMGIGAVLFYLRRLSVARRQPRGPQV